MISADRLAEKQELMLAKKAVRRILRRRWRQRRWYHAKMKAILRQPMSFDEAMLRRRIPLRPLHEGDMRRWR